MEGQGIPRRDRSRSLRSQRRRSCSLGGLTNGVTIDLPDLGPTPPPEAAAPFPVATSAEVPEAVAAEPEAAAAQSLDGTFTLQAARVEIRALWSRIHALYDEIHESHHLLLEFRRALQLHG